MDLVKEAARAAGCDAGAEDDPDAGTVTDDVACAPLPEVGPGLPPFDDVRLIAHAGGSPEGLQGTEHYSNSREAFEVSYVFFGWRAIVSKYGSFV